MKMRLGRAEGPVLRCLSSHSPLIDRLDSIGGIRATVHVAVLSARCAVRDADGEGGASAGAGPERLRKAVLVRDSALRRLREDLPYLLLALASLSPENAACRGDAVEGLRIISMDPAGGGAGALASRLGGKMQAAWIEPAAIRKAVAEVEESEGAMRADADQFESARLKLARHRAYEGLEALIPDMLLALDSDPRDASSLRGLELLRRRVTPLARPGAALAGIVLESISAHSVQERSQDPSEASVDLP